MDYGFSYNFQALRGHQAGKEYFIVMCPLRLIPKIFLFDEEEIPPQYRAQRILNKNRIPDITNYVIENPNDYVFSSLTASVDGEMEFHPLSTEKKFENLGELHISLNTRFLINDGQHRRAAIEEALKVSPELGEETISIVFYRDYGLKKSQQIFSDLNRHAVNTTTSIGILYDSRDKLSLITKDIVFQNKFLSKYTDMERVSLSKNSPKIIALNHVFNTNLRLLKKAKGDACSKEDEKFLKSFWVLLTKSIPEWQMILKKEITPKELRMNYIVGHGIFLEAVGIIAQYAYKYNKTSWEEYIKALAKIDWHRSNTKDWEGRVFSKNGRIQKTNLTIQLTANLIKNKVGLKLTDSEKKIENKFKGGTENA